MVLNLVNTPLEAQAVLNYDGKDPTKDGELFPKLRWTPSQSDPARKTLSHLRSTRYGPILAQLSKTEAESDSGGKVVDTLVRNFVEVVEKALFVTSGLPPFEGRPSQSEFYDARLIRRELYSHVNRRLEDRGYPGEPISLSAPDASETAPYLRWGNYRVAKGSLDELKQLRAKLEDFLSDPTLERSVSGIVEADKARVANPERLKFESLRREVAERLEYRHEALKGQCALCPPRIGALPLDPVRGELDG